MTPKRWQPLAPLPGFFPSSQKTRCQVVGLSPWCWCWHLRNALSPACSLGQLGEEPRKRMSNAPGSKRSLHALLLPNRCSPTKSIEALVKARATCSHVRNLVRSGLKRGKGRKEMMKSCNRPEVPGLFSLSGPHPKEKILSRTSSLPFLNMQHFCGNYSNSIHEKLIFSRWKLRRKVRAL